MFEVGMSALVLKICSEYAKSLGLNFPPCTQQEINAICEWVDKHTIKDMTISQDGYNVTFTFKTENDTTKEFTFTIPKAVDINELEKVLKGSDSVVVDRLSDNSGLQVKLAQSVLNDINNKLAKPANPTSDSVVTMAANGTVGTKPLSEIGGNLYSHRITVIGNLDGLNSVNLTFTVIRDNNEKANINNWYEFIQDGIFYQLTGAVMGFGFEYGPRDSSFIGIRYFYYRNNEWSVSDAGAFEPTEFSSDIVTEV